MKPSLKNETVFLFVENCQGERYKLCCSGAYGFVAKAVEGVNRQVRSQALPALPADF
jgi:hypothetical protein